MSHTNQPERFLGDALIPVDIATGYAWVKRGDFPPLVVLNPGQRRSVVAFRESDVLRWMAERPQGFGHRLADSAYETRRANSAAKRAAEADAAPPRRKLPLRSAGRPVAAAE